MKKTLTAAITTALVIGAASTTFAAANPFTDVPTGHWSYDAVAKLAQDGVIEGYGDGTFRGDKAITRYEMAQMVAKAMAKSDVSAADKAAIDKLAAEYSAELNNLGVRVGELENKVDNVKWGGKARLRMDSQSDETSSTVLGDNSYSHAYVDLWATAKINDGWVAKVEHETEKNMRNDSTNTDEDTKVFVEGKLFGADATIGKFGAFSKDGLVIDKGVSGAKFAFGNELKTVITAGRLDIDKVAGDSAAQDYQAIEFSYAINDKTSVNAGYHILKDETLKALTDKNLKIWEIGFNTKLGQDWAFVADYAKSNIDVNKDSSYFTQFTYKAADVKTEGSYDIFVNYRQIANAANIAQTWGDYSANQKGWALGFDYVPAENVNFQAFYFDGKDVDNSDAKTKFVRAQVELFF